MRYGIRCREKCIPMPTMYVRAFSTSDDHIEYSLSWDTDGIPFLIDNNANAIIRSQRRLFTVPLIPKLMTLEILEGLTTTNKLSGSMKLILTDDANKNHSYRIPRCVFDPKTPVNILGVPDIGTFFGDNAETTDPLVDDGTAIKSGSKKSHFIWDHGRQEGHFMHGSICMPELYLYFGHRYFKDFCTRVHKFLYVKVHFDFCSAYYIYPQTSDVINTYDTHAIPYGKRYLDGEEPHHQWYCPEIEKPTDQYSN